MHFLLLPIRCNTPINLELCLVPTYQYICNECEHAFEVLQAFTDEAISTCPSCAKDVRKVYSSVGIVFKGSGFYKTDSRNSPDTSKPAATAPNITTPSVTAPAAANSTPTTTTPSTPTPAATLPTKSATSK